MKNLRFKLVLSEKDQVCLDELQKTFLTACNELAKIVVKENCWNRVALHHMGYRMLREKYPRLGSQMTSNVIYAVSKYTRRVYSIVKNQKDKKFQTLPTMIFMENSPVFYDKNTLSQRDGILSIYTMDGRVKVKMNTELKFELQNLKLKEAMLIKVDSEYILNLKLEEDDNEILPSYVTLKRVGKYEFLN